MSEDTQREENKCPKCGTTMIGFSGVDVRGNVLACTNTQCGVTLIVKRESTMTTYPPKPNLKNNEDQITT